MGLTEWALKGHYKKLRESPEGKLLREAFEKSGFNDGTAVGLDRAIALYKDFYLSIGAADYAPDHDAREFAAATANNRFPILFNAALDYALNAFSDDQLLQFYRENKDLVSEGFAYLDALYPEFMKSRPRTAANFNDVHVFQTQMYLLITGVHNYIHAKS